MSIAFAALDIEATGMDPARHEIIEIAVVSQRADGKRETFSSLVRPKHPLTLDIERLTGIGQADVRNAPTFAEMQSPLRAALADIPVIGHSIDLDLAMVAAAGLRLQNEWFDTFNLASVLLPNLPNYSLDAVAMALGLAPTGSHRALPDAERSADVFVAMLERLQALDAVTLDQLASLARIAEWSTASLFDRLAGEKLRGPLFGADDAGDGAGTHELAFLTQRQRPEPLRPTDSANRVDLDRISNLLSGQSPLAETMPHYEVRPQQHQMATAVGQAFNDDRDLIVEAGTGTGKSMAYLLPAALHAMEHGEQVVISTNTVALQDQLFRKDIPDLRRALADNGAGGTNGEHHAVNDNLHAVVLKGRANYLCLRRWFSANRQPVTDPVDAGLRAKILLWLGQTETGDRAELRLSGDEEIAWRALAEEEHACLASRCVFQQRNQCFLFRARRESESAHLVVVNHALLLSDAIAGSRVLPEFNRLIVDEAHHLEDQATSQFGFSVTEREVLDVIDAVIKADGREQTGALVAGSAYLARQAHQGSDRDKRRAAAAIERAKAALEVVRRGRNEIHQLFIVLDDVAGRRGSEDRMGQDRRARITDDVRGDAMWLGVLDSWARLERDFLDLESRLRWFDEALGIAEPGPSADDEAIQLFDTAAADTQSAHRRIADLTRRVAETIAAPGHEQVYWLERGGLSPTVSLHAAPLRVGGLLRERVFDRMTSTVLTSATFTTDGNFDFVSERLGLERPKQLMVPSPFDYAASTLLYLVDDIPEPNGPGYQRALQDAIVEGCVAARGRALVLFTSHAALQATYRGIKRTLEDAGIVVLAQRTDGSPRQLVERLRTMPNVVVLGTSSFWEGIDVVGDALSLLMIAKLPFAVPTDPVFASRGELLEDEGRHPFLDYAVPTAVLKLKQGFGRLIRSSRDRGICVLLDRRVLSKRYGRSFVDSLPECTVRIGSSRDLGRATESWLANDEVVR